jgi:hypothetical protein
MQSDYSISIFGSAKYRREGYTDSGKFIENRSCSENRSAIPIEVGANCLVSTKKILYSVLMIAA